MLERTLRSRTQRLEIYALNAACTAIQAQRFQNFLLESPGQPVDTTNFSDSEGAEI